MSGLREIILVACDAVDAAREDLGALDGIAGDGDHGVTMATAARNVRAKLDAAPNATGADLLRQVAMGVGSVGGAIGPIYATAILRIAALPLAAPVTVAQMRACAEAAEAGIVALGKAKPGDKTVVDALHPLVESLRASEAAGASPDEAAAAAVAAARAGAESTANMIATIGRASRLGERSRGWADPGATSFAIIVGALAGAFAGQAAKE
jgi:phosphoenolpyruvate---glycerone phosphotransferase subunit DhaL